MEETIDAYWKERQSPLGKRCDIMDGEIWLTAKLKDGRQFFDQQDMTGDLRIGVTMHLDW